MPYRGKLWGIKVMHYKYLFFIIPFFSLILISCSQESVEILYETGEDLWTRGETEESLGNFLKIIEKYPDNDLYDDAIFKAGELYYLSNSDFLNAIKYFKQLLLIQNSRTKLRFQAQSYIAEIYENSLNDYDQAIIEYQRLINSFENWISPDVGQYSIARCYYKKGDYRQAIVEYETLIEQFSISPLVEESLAQIVTSYFILGDCSKAVSKYNLFKEKFSESQFMPEIKFEIGSCYEEEGNLVESLVFFRELKDVYPNKKLLDVKINSIERRLSVRKR